MCWKHYCIMAVLWFQETFESLSPIFLHASLFRVLSMHFDMSWHKTDKTRAIYERDYNFNKEFEKFEPCSTKWWVHRVQQLWSHHLAAQTSHYQTLRLAVSLPGTVALTQTQKETYCTRSYLSYLLLGVVWEAAKHSGKD